MNSVTVAPSNWQTARHLPEDGLKLAGEINPPIDEAQLQPSRTLVNSYMSTYSNAVAEVTLNDTSPSGEEEYPYSKVTVRYFYGFVILFVLGIGFLVSGYLLLIPLLSAFGPLVMGLAFGSLWICLRRAQKEHG